MSHNLKPIKQIFGEARAPNGLPVHKNSVKWFNDSKMMDAQGKPLVLYHYSNQSNRASIAKSGLIGSDATSPGGSRVVFLSDTYKPQLGIDTYAIDATKIDLQPDETTDAPDGDRWFAVYGDIAPTKIISSIDNRDNLNMSRKDITQPTSHDAMISGEDAIAAMNPVELDNLDPGFIKDNAGLPVTLYHGGLKWDKFDSGKSGREALWLTPEVSVASGYADQYSESDGREIKAFHVSMRKPLDLRDSGVVDQVFGAEESPEAHEIARDRSLVEQALKYAKAHGHDGLIHPDSDNLNRYTDGQVSYAVFGPDQLHLAPLTGNEQDYNTYGIALRGEDIDPLAQIRVELGSVIRERIRA